MAQMKIRSGRIKARFDAQRPIDLAGEVRRSRRSSSRINSARPFFIYASCSSTGGKDTFAICNLRPKDLPENEICWAHWSEALASTVSCGNCMVLHTIDWVIAAACLLICFLPALAFGKRSGQSTSEFFASGRSVPWWLAGISLVATTFSSDTPNLVANIVRTQGVAGNWQWWAFTLTGVSTVFFYARLWRRSGVLTDLEFYELRYSGNSAVRCEAFAPYI